MAKDIDIIRQLEKKLKIKLKQLDKIDIYSPQTGYVIDNQGNITCLSLFDTKIKDISALKGLTNLTTLVLIGNQITDISAVAELNNLTELYLSANQITDLSALKGLTNLTTLYLSHNQITDLSAVGELTNLTTLSLIGNKITDLSAVGGLKNLTTLNLTNNQIKDLSAVGGLTNLTSLYLRNNQITDLSAIGGLMNLTTLDLSKNQIKELPPEILELNTEIKWEFEPDEKGVFLADNPLEKPPVEIVKQGKEAIREYFKSLTTEQKKLLNEVKVLLVGDGGAGKTSLVKRLLHNTFDPEEKQTHGVYIDHGRFKTNGKEITAHFWDFGGQGIMQAAHQLFFSIRSLYILVMNARQEPDPEDWFKRIETFGGDSPIIVVINKIDDNPYNLNEKDLQRKYPSIKSFHHVSCKTKAGLKDLKIALQKQLIDVKMIQTELPLSWFNVKERLEALKEKNYITRDAYNEICRQENVTEPKTLDTLIDYLHDLGVALHYKDYELLNTQVLNPQWVTRAIYKIINSKELKEEGKEGILPKSRLSYILNEEVLPDFQIDGIKYSPQEERYIVELMKKFELCFDLDHQGYGECILVPDLLKPGESDYQFPKTDILRFYFEYDFLPSSVFPRFMFKSQQDIDPNLCWRTGLIISDKKLDARALVRLDKNKRQIHIYVAGTQKRAYFFAIRKILSDINNSFEKLSFVEWVPLPDQPDFAVEYDELLGHEDTRRDKIFIGKLRKEYDVSKLLDGIETPKERKNRKKRGGIKIGTIRVDGTAILADEISKIEHMRGKYNED